MCKCKFYVYVLYLAGGIPCQNNEKSNTELELFELVLYSDIPVSSANITVYTLSRWDSFYLCKKDCASNLDMTIFILSASSTPVH